MSTTLKLTWVNVGVLFSIGLSAGGGVWAVAQRDRDLTGLHQEMQEVKAVQATDHDLLITIKADIKWLREQSTK